jgi:hypothetical protein
VTGERASSPRGALAVMCALFLLVGVAIGHEHGLDWLRGPPTAAAGGTMTASARAVLGPGTAAIPAGHTPGMLAFPAREPAPAGTRAVGLAVVGDTMMGSPAFGLPPDGGASFFARVAPLLSGDVVLANLEGTFSTSSGSKCPTPAPDADEEERRRASNCYAFQTPPGYARHMAAAGVTVANLANNHSFDFGPAGVEETLAALREAGVADTGLAGTAAEIVTGGGRVVVLGFAPYAWADPLLDIGAAAARVSDAAAQADIVVVTFHGGAEGAEAIRVPEGAETYLGEQRGDLRAFSHAMVDAGADLVVGHGPHVLRGMEVYRGRLVAYSLGNFAGYGSAFNLAGPLSTSMVLRAVLEPDGSLRRGRIHPTVLTSDGTPAPGGDAIAIVRSLSQQDFAGSAPRIGDDGTILPPATGSAGG